MSSPKVLWSFVLSITILFATHSPEALARHSRRGLQAPKNTVYRQLVGRVVRVSDGDTVVILEHSEQTKIRLLGIDAPEKSMPFGRVCTSRLAFKIAGREVTVDIIGTDQYGRSLGKILLGGKDINLSQVEDGCAWHYKQYEKTQTVLDRQLYGAKEREARKLKKGLWVDPNPRPPWDFRHEEKSRVRSD